MARKEEEDDQLEVKVKNVRSEGSDDKEDPEVQYTED